MNHSSQPVLVPDEDDKETEHHYVYCNSMKRGSRMHDGDFPARSAVVVVEDLEEEEQDKVVVVHNSSWEEKVIFRSTTSTITRAQQEEGDQQEEATKRRKRATPATGASTTTEEEGDPPRHRKHPENKYDYFKLPMNRHELVRRRERFLLFSRVLLNMLHHRKDYQECQRLQAILQDCKRRHDSQQEHYCREMRQEEEEGHLWNRHLVPSLHRALIDTVRKDDWNQAQTLLEHFLCRRRQIVLRYRQALRRHANDNNEDGQRNLYDEAVRIRADGS